MAMTAELPARDLFAAGNTDCGGCGLGTNLRLFLEVTGPKVVFSIPACCAAVAVGPVPRSSFGVPVLNTAFEVTGASASGIRAALDIRGEDDVTVVGWAGDGGTYDIGLQSLSGAAERETDFIYVCYDNEAYMNTGIQRSSSTPRGTWTTTTPSGLPEAHRKKDLIGILAAHRVPYIATLSPAYPDDFRAKVKKALAMKGTRFLLAYSPCPTGWRMESRDSIKVARLAVESGAFPLFEIENGEKTRITVAPPDPLRPLEDYLSIQGRFRDLLRSENAELLEELRGDVIGSWESLAKRAC